MRVMTFEQFIGGKWESNGRENLYVLYDGDGPLYVGITRDHPWTRWFGSGGRGHMLQTYAGRWVGLSGVGLHVVDNMPDSLAYTMELWTVKDCLKYLDAEAPGRYCAELLEDDLDEVEELMIGHLHPALNAMHNSSPRPLSLKNMRHANEGVSL